MRLSIRRIFTLILCVLTAASSVTVLSGCNAGTNPPQTETSGNSDGTSAAYPDKSNKKKIAFTFDDGPHAPVEDLEEGYYPYTTYILDKLESLGMKATFFVVGNRLMDSNNAAATSRAYSLGCEIGSHTYTHDKEKADLKNIRDDGAIRTLVTENESIVANLCGGKKPVLFRPVGGNINERQLKIVASAGYTTVGWSIDSRDWENHPKPGDKFSSDAERNAKYEKFVSEKVDAIVGQAQDGDIVLLHDIYMSSVDIFRRAADILVSRGFELVTVSELCGFDGKQEAKPVMYLSKNSTVTHMGKSADDTNAG